MTPMCINKAKRPTSPPEKASLKLDEMHGRDRDVKGFTNNICNNSCNQSQSHSENPSEATSISYRKEFPHYLTRNNVNQEMNIFPIPLEKFDHKKQKLCKQGGKKNNQDQYRYRRRKRFQKPGVTAKNQPRKFVEHNYHDHANDEVSKHVSGTKASCSKRKGYANSFPFKLHGVLHQIGLDRLSHIMSWQPHGRAFRIHDMRGFISKVMYQYFGHKKITSFQRQLSVYGFQKLTVRKGCK